MSKDLIIRANPFTCTKFKNIDRSKRLVAGYYSSWDVADSYKDRMRRGATLKSVAENGPRSQLPRIKHFMNHDIYMPVSKLTDMGEDDFGAWYEGIVGTHKLGDDFIEQCDSGIITEHSFGLSYVNTNVLEDGTTELLQVKVWEVSSLTAWGANPFTPFKDNEKAFATIEAKAAFFIEKQKKIEKFIKDSTATDETLQSLTIYLKELTQYIIDSFTITTPAVDKSTPEPGTEDLHNIPDYSGLLDSVKSWTNTFKN